MPNVTIETSESFSTSLDYVFGNGRNIIIQRYIESLPSTPSEGQIEGFEEGKRARLISTNLAGKNFKKFAKQFMKIAKRRPDTSKLVIKVNISLKPGEKLDAHQLKELANSLREEIGFKDSPYVVVEHRDKDHQHLHIIFSRVTFDVQLVSNKFDRLKARTWARQIEQKFNLTPTPQRSPRKLMTQGEMKKFLATGIAPQFAELQKQIDESVTAPASKFVETLESKNIGVIVYYTNEKPSGISFAIEGRKYAGGKLGAEFSWGGLLARGLTYDAARDDEIIKTFNLLSKEKFSGEKIDKKSANAKPEGSPEESPAPSKASNKNDSVLTQINAGQSFVLTQLPNKSWSGKSSDPLTAEDEFQKATVSTNSEEITTGKEEITFVAASSNNLGALTKNDNPKSDPAIENKGFEGGETNPEFNSLEIESEVDFSGQPVESLNQNLIEFKSLNSASNDASKEQLNNAYQSVAETNSKPHCDDANYSLPSEALLLAVEKTGDQNTNSARSQNSVDNASVSDSSAKREPVVRNFSAGYREQLLKDLTADFAENLRKLNGTLLTYQQQKELKKSYRLQDENKSSFNQWMEIKLIQKQLTAPLPNPVTFFEGEVLKIDNCSAQDRSLLILKRIDYINNQLSTKENSKPEPSSLGDKKPMDSAKNSFANLSHPDEQEQPADGIFQNGQDAAPLPETAASLPKSSVDHSERSKRLQTAVSASLEEQGVKLTSEVQERLNGNIENSVRETPRKEEIIAAGAAAGLDAGSRYVTHRFETLEVIMYSSNEKQRDEVSLALAMEAREDFKLQKESEESKISVDPSLPKDNSTSIEINSDSAAEQILLVENRKDSVNKIIAVCRDAAERGSIEISADVYEKIENELLTIKHDGDLAKQEVVGQQELEFKQHINKQRDAKSSEVAEELHKALEIKHQPERDALICRTLINYQSKLETAENTQSVDNIKSAETIQPISHNTDAGRDAVIKTNENAGVSTHASNNSSEKADKHNEESKSSKNAEIISKLEAAPESGDPGESALPANNRQRTIIQVNSTANSSKSSGSAAHEAEQKYQAALAEHTREVSESRYNDFDLVRRNASRYADIVARARKQRQPELSLESLSKLWQEQYNQSHHQQWKDNQTARISRREWEIKESILVAAKDPGTENINRSRVHSTGTASASDKTAFQSNNLMAKNGHLTSNQAASNEQKVALIMNEVRRSHTEWMAAVETGPAAKLHRTTERLMQFFTERDAALPPEEKSLETANFMADAYKCPKPYFANELDEKTWVIGILPESGKQLFCENIIERYRANSASLLADMQKIQLNESLQIIRAQAEQLNKTITQPQLNQIRQSLHEAAKVQASQSSIEHIRQVQMENGYKEIVTPISRLDAIHTALTKTERSEQNLIANTLIEQAQIQTRQEELKEKAEIEAQTVERNQGWILK